MNALERVRSSEERTDAKAIASSPSAVARRYPALGRVVGCFQRGTPDPRSGFLREALTHDALPNQVGWAPPLFTGRQLRLPNSFVYRFYLRFPQRMAVNIREHGRSRGRVGFFRDPPFVQDVFAPDGCVLLLDPFCNEET